MRGMNISCAVCLRGDHLHYSILKTLLWIVCGSLSCTFFNRRTYTNKILWILLRLYGIGPDYNKSIPGLYPGQSLPSGVTYAINPSLVRLSTDDKYTATLVIYVSPNTTPRSYKLSLDSILIYPVEKESVSVTTLSILLVVLPKE